MHQVLAEICEGSVPCIEPVDPRVVTKLAWHT